MQVTTETLIILDSVDSTNNYAMGLIHSGMAKSGIAVMARHQFKGKGRKEKDWISTEGMNLTISLIYQIHFLPVYNQFHLTLCASLAVYDLFKSLNIDVRIKWPNDIYYHDRKSGGILIENVITGNKFNWTVIGIGINVNQIIFEDGLNATSIAAITNKETDITSLALDLQKFMTLRLDQLQSHGHQLLLEEYNSMLFGKNKTFKLRKENTIFETTIKGVNNSGELETFDTMPRTFLFDEIEWII